MKWKYTKAILGIAFAVVLSASLCLTPSASASLESGKWKDNSKDPVVLEGNTWTSDEYNQAFSSRMGIHTRQTCSNQQVELIGGYLQEDCMYDTTIGKVGRGGYLYLPKGETEGGYINGGRSQLFPTAYPDTYLEVVPGEDGSVLNIRTKNTVGVEYERDDNGEEIPLYKWTTPPTMQITKQDGSSWIIDDNILYSQVWYSESGRWMLIMDRQGFVVRVDLKDLKFLALQATIPTDEGDYFATMDISPDGGQIAVNIFGHPLRLIDAEACKKYETTHITDPKFCALKFLNSYITQANPNNYYGFGNLPIFRSNTVLEYIAIDDGDYLSYYIFAPGTKELGNYIALGDSFASGEGAKMENYFKGTAVYKSNECHLSKKSYPYLLSELDSVSAIHSVACSGARLQNVSGTRDIDRDLKRDNRTNQYIIPLSNEVGNDWMPGYELQNSFIDNKKPDISTISIGGNDVGFSNIIHTCVGGGHTCFETYEDRTELIDIVNSKFDGLVDVYKQIKRDSPGIKLYVVGYPQIISSNNCGDTHLKVKEAEFARHFISYLNEVIELAAKRAGVYYVDTEQAFNGHRICDNTNQPAMNGLRLRLTRHLDRITRVESFHPNEKGHELFSETIKSKTNNLTAPMPRSDNSFSQPGATLSLKAYQLLDAAPVTGRATRIVEHADDSVEDVTLGGYVKFGVKGALGWIAKRSSIRTITSPIRFEQVINSEPRHLGYVDFDPNDSEQISIQIPKDIEPGFHTIHLYAQLDNGEKIDIQKQVFVHATTYDWNGDGVSDYDEGCTLFDAYPNMVDTSCEYYDEKPVAITAGESNNKQSNTQGSRKNKSATKSNMSNEYNVKKSQQAQSTTANQEGSRENKMSFKEVDTQARKKTHNKFPHLRKNLPILVILTIISIIIILSLKKLTHAHHRQKT